MAVVVVFQGPSLTQETYEQSVSGLTGGKKIRMEEPSDWPVEGILAHVAGQTPNGFRVVDVWDSEESVRRFGEKLMPILQGMGVQIEPEIYPTYAFVTT